MEVKLIKVCNEEDFAQFHLVNSDGVKLVSFDAEKQKR